MSEKVIKTIILNTARTMVPSSKVGRPHKSHEDLLEQFLRILRTGAPWRDVRNIDFRTAHRHFIRWARLGVFESAYQKLLRLVRRPRRDRSFLVVDTTFVKNVFGTDVVGRNPTDLNMDCFEKRERFGELTTNDETVELLRQSSKNCFMIRLYSSGSSIKGACPDLYIHTRVWDGATMSLASAGST